MRAEGQCVYPDNVSVHQCVRADVKRLHLALECVEGGRDILCATEFGGVDFEAQTSGRRCDVASAQRYSIPTVRPSVQPNSRSRWTNAATQGLQAESVPAPKKLTIGSLVDCCARCEWPRSRTAKNCDELAPSHCLPRGSGTASYRFKATLGKGANVRFGSKADMCNAINHVRFTPERGHSPTRE